MNPLVMPITIYRGVSFYDYVYVPNQVGNVGEDLSGYTLKAEVRDKPGGTLLATLTCTNATAPEGEGATQGWVQLYLASTTSIPTGYHRGVWSLLAGAGGTKPEIIAHGPVEIVKTATTW